ncbi:MAG TPA: stage II sporulation protein M, partial [Methanosarcina sp.]|nr:stage II sporulation protein M [Methanosarcina sp.]
MEREGDYIEERRARIQAGTPEGEKENSGYIAEEEGFLPESSTAETWRDSLKDPKKGFTGYVRFIWPY